RHKGQRDADHAGPARPEVIGEPAHEDAEDRAAEQRRRDQEALLGGGQVEVLGDEVAERAEQVPDAEAEIEVDESGEEGRPVAGAAELTDAHADLTIAGVRPRRGGPNSTRPVRASNAAWWHGHSKRPLAADQTTGQPR